MANSVQIDPINERMRAVGVLANGLNGMKDEEAKKRVLRAMDLLLASVDKVIYPSEIEHMTPVGIA